VYRKMRKNEYFGSLMVCFLLMGPAIKPGSSLDLSAVPLGVCVDVVTRSPCAQEFGVEAHILWPADRKALVQPLLLQQVSL
jgi:hypothetical protein